MTRFGHKLNYVINTFVKHTPVSETVCRTCICCPLSFWHRYKTDFENKNFLSHFLRLSRLAKYDDAL